MRASLCLLAAVFLIAGTARADDRDEARKAFADGQAADKAEDWQTAIEHYQHAYDLVPHHFALYNIARDYERLGQLREASVWYARYVEAAPPGPDRDKATRLLGELKLRPGKLTVKSMPAGARVTIDQQKVGVTPWTGPVKGGDHRVAVELEGQRDERDVTLEFGEPETVEIELSGVGVRQQPGGGPGGAGGTGEPRIVRPIGSQGTIVVRGRPEGALITVDNMPAGTVPTSIPVGEGQHSIKITQYGYSDFSTTAFVQRGAEAPIDVNLTKGGLGGGAVDANGNKMQMGYMLGFGAGADLRGDGGVYLGELGYRFGPADFSFRIGKAAGYTSVDFVIRWALLRTKLAPFLGGGYSYVKNSSDETGSSSSSSSGGSGFEAVGGLRYDLMRGDSGAGFALLAEAGLRTYSGVTDDMGASKSGVFVPFMVVLEAVFGAKRQQ